MKQVIYYSKSMNDKGESISRKRFAEKALDIYKDLIGEKVLVKPNHVSFEEYPATTHSQMLEVVIEWLQKNGYQFIVGDGKAIDVFKYKMRNTPLKQVCQKYSIEFTDFYKEKMVEYQTPRGWSVTMADIGFKVDTIISLPVLKAHPQGRLRMTGALKNVVGFFSRQERFMLHPGSIVKDPFKTIAEANWILTKSPKAPKQIIIEDAIYTLIKANERRHGGQFSFLGYLLAGICPVVLDIYGFSLLKQVEPAFKDKDYDYIKYLPYAIEYGVGGTDYEIKEI